MPDGPYVWDEARRAVELRFRSGDYVIQVAAAGSPGTAEIARAAADGSGWRSRYYYSREPALSFTVSADAAAQVFVTLLAPAPASVHIDAERTIHVTAGGRAYRVAADGTVTDAAA